MAVSPQGSRAGLITAVVIFAILFVTSTIFAIYFGVNGQKSEEAFNNFKKKYAGVVSEASLASAEVQGLKDLRGDPASGFNQQMSVLDVALAQRDVLSKVITGATTNAAQAKAAGATALTRASTGLKESGVVIPSNGENLTGAIDTMVGAIATRDGQIKDLTSQLTAAKTETASKVKEVEDLTTDRDKQIQTVRADADKQVADAVQGRGATETNFKGIETDYDKKFKDAQEAANKQQVALADKDRQLEGLQHQIDQMRNKLSGLRVNTINPTIRQSDGEIIRSPGQNIVYINLGFGDQVTPGLTFEVYDRQDGPPALNEGANEDELPVGKASIEVIRVGPTSSECRVVKQQTGSTLTEGDPIVNLVYDRNTKYNFRVYGNFDLDQNGTATPGDAEIIKRLVTQWGGRLTDDVNTDTDFVILGKEPVLPNFSREDLSDSINAAKLAAAQQEIDKYEELRGKARDLHIPILNQNRFLYFIGYYDQAKR